VIPWTRPLDEKLAAVRRAFQMAKEHGDPAFAGFASRAITTTLFAMGHPLDEVERQAEEEIEFARQFGFFLAKVSAPVALLRTLRGMTTKFGALDDEQSTERSFEQGLASHNPTNAFLETYYWVRKLRARFFVGDYASAVDAADKAERWYEMCATLALFLTETADFHFYAALSRAARCEPMGPDPYAKHRETLRRHEQQLLAWAANCPANFEDRATLVGAEIARIEGRPLDAMDLYERAIASARANRFVHNEALAYELAARYYAARRFTTIEHAYLREARSSYLRWGADGKVRHLESLHSFLREPESAHTAAATIAVPVEHLDYATVVKVSQALSGEMVLERLIGTLMRLAIEHAGAERGLLLLSRGNDLQLEAEAMTSRDGIIVRRRDAATDAHPDSIVHYVMRSRVIVILDDASAHPTYSSDPYVRERRARSVLCLALVNESKVTGVLYLENNLAANVFTSDRVAILKVLASQAAISLENSYLYRDLADREGKIQRLVDANILAICIWQLEGAIVAANEEFLRMLQYSREDIVSGRLRWIDMTPTELREQDERAVAELRTSGSFRPFEKEFFRKNGSRVPVLIGGALFEDGGSDGVAFVLDVSERKKAEQALRELESNFAHMNRVSLMGELAASLSHEITQSIASARNNARAGLNFLNKQAPDLPDVREALSCVLGDADRAGDIVGRIRDQIRKAPPRKGHFDLNAAISEVIVLTRSAIVRNGISVRTRLAEQLPSVHGDRVQLQQVILNLILNGVEAMGSVEVGARELLISTEQDYTGFRIAVRDSGPGIDPADLERIFEAFYTTKSSGTGMGLSICRSIIDAHGGRLWSEPNEPRGVVFQFTLPRAQVKS
jgi:PAS domain S-box-containing protein